MQRVRSGKQPSVDATPAIISASLALLGVAGALSLAALRIMYERFYEALGASVDDTGVSPWRLALKPGVTLAAYLAFSAPGLLLGTVVLVYSRRAAKFFSSGQLKCAFLILLAALSQGLLLALAGRNIRDVAIFLIAFAGLFAVMAFVLLVPHEIGRRNAACVVAILVGVNAVALWTVGYSRALTAAQHLRVDGTTSSKGKFALDLLDPPRTTACVSWLEPPSLNPSATPGTFVEDRPVLILGSSGGLLLLFQRTRIFRVPESRVQVTQITGSEMYVSCSSLQAPPPSTGDGTAS